MSRAALYYLLPVVMGALLNLGAPAPRPGGGYPTVPDSSVGPERDCPPPVSDRRDVVLAGAGGSLDLAPVSFDCAVPREGASTLP